MSRETRYDEAQRRTRDEGLHNPTEMGEMLRFENLAHRKRIGKKWGLDHPDFETRQRNIKRFQRSDDYERVKVYKPRHF